MNRIPPRNFSSSITLSISIKKCKYRLHFSPQIFRFTYRSYKRLIHRPLLRAPQVTKRRTPMAIRRSPRGEVQPQPRPLQQDETPNIFQRWWAPSV